MKTSSSVLLVTLLCLGVCLVAAVKHNCKHDIITRGYKPTKLKISASKARSLAGAATLYRPINIQFDYGGLKFLDGEKAGFIMNTLMPAVKEYLQGIIQVKYVPGNKWAFPLSTCYQSQVPAAYKQPIIESDLIIFVTFKDEEDSYIAWATTCAMDPLNNRPRAGQVNFRLASIRTEPIEFRSIFETTIHEITHVLGLSRNLYSNFVDEFGKPLGRDKVVKDVKIRNEPTMIIVTPLVQKYVRSQFACPTAEGAELENQGAAGSKGSHWERRNFMNEIMTASDIEGVVMSNLTLSFLADSGWYKINFAGAQELTWGKNAGCKFLNDNCFSVTGKPIYEGFCPQMNVEGCTHRHYSKAHCSFSSRGGSISVNFDYFNGKGMAMDSYADNCPYYSRYSNGDCRDIKNADANTNYLYDQAWGPSSRCFAGNYIKKDALKYASSRLSMTHATCHTFKCETEPISKKMYAIINVGNTTVKCPPQGGNVTIPGYEGFLNCPAGDVFCFDETINECGPNNNCNGVGVCWRNKCICPADLDSKDCTPNPPLDCLKSKCNGKGYCIGGKCTCDAGYGGRECEKKVLSMKCYKCSSFACKGDQCLPSIEALFD